MGVSTAAFQTGTHLLLALVVLFGGSVSVAMLGLLLGTVYFLPGPPPRWSLCAGVGVSILGAALSGVGITVAVVTRGAGGDAAWWLLATGAVLYLAGLSWLELRARPDTAW